MNKISIDGIEYEILLEKKKIKNIYLRVKTGRQLLISAHPSVPMIQIEKFIQTKAKWILEASERLEKKVELNKDKGIQTSSIQFLGKKYPLEIVKGNKASLSLKENKVVLVVRSIDEKDIQKTFDDQAKKILKEICDQYCPKFDQMMDDYWLAHPTISYRKMTSKWGSCMPSKAKITMNTNLIYMPVECIEYVLLHEYAHMIVPNHSTRFYDVIKYHMPNYKKIQNILKEK